MKQLFILVLLFAPLVHAAIGTGGGNCSAVEETSDNSLGCTVGTQNVEVGNIFICRFGNDNAGSGDAADQEVTEIADSGGNQYAFLAGYRNGQGSATTGAQVEVWLSKITTQLTSGSSTLTVTFQNNLTDKTMECSEFTVAAGNTLVQSTAYVFETQDGADAGSLAFSGLSSLERLYLRATATESNAAVSMTASAFFTLLPTDGCTNTTGGGEATDMGICTEYRIFTGTGTSSNPTLVDTTNDNVSVFLALHEAASAPPPRRRVFAPSVSQ